MLSHLADAECRNDVQMHAGCAYRALSLDTVASPILATKGDTDRQV
jgi:hypothetical protein